MKWKLALALIVLLGSCFIGYMIKKDVASPKDVVVVFGEDSSNLTAYSSLKEEFSAKTGIQMRFEGATFEQSIQKADADFRTGKAAYDIVLQYNFSLAPYVKNHYVAEIGEVFSPSVLNNSRINEGMFESALKETCYYYSDPLDTKSPPKQFGFPFAANTMLLVYNRDLFENADFKQRFKDETGKDLLPPTSWQDYLTAAEFFAKIQPDLKGVCMQGASDGWLYYELCNYLFSMGTKTSAKQFGWEEDAPITIATAKNEEVLRYCKRLRQSSSGDFFTVGASQQREIMLQGKTAMALMWSDYLQPLATSKSPRFGFARVPGDISGLAGGAFYINRKSRHTQSASQFVLYALALENQIKLIEKGLCSPLKIAYTDDVFARVPYARALKDSLEHGVFMFEAGSDAEIINDALTTWVQKYIRGEVSETEALTRAQQEVVTKRAKAR
jgi:multiple sugar transport system substrate-binding protein